MKTRKLLSLILAAAMLLGLLPVLGAAAAPTAQAANITWEEVNVSDMDDLKTKLSDATHDWFITLTADLSKVVKQSSEWCTIQGNKKLNLNGHSVYLKNESDQEETTMLVIGQGANFYLKDATADGYTDTGKIQFDGYMESAKEFESEDVRIRHVFLVKNGTFNVSGGQIIAGRSKQQWVTHAYVREDRDFSCDQAKSFTGYARNQINGCAVNVEAGGVLNVYGGYLEGRGYSGYTSSGPVLPLAAVYVTAADAQINIYSGHFQGRGGADALRASSQSTVRIWAGEFSEAIVDNLVIPWQDHLDPTNTDNVEIVNYVSYLSKRPYAVYDMKSGDYGVSGVTADMLAQPQRAAIWVSQSRGDSATDYAQYSPEEYGNLAKDSKLGRRVVVAPSENAYDVEVSETGHEGELWFTYNPTKDAAPVFRMSGFEPYWPKVMDDDGAPAHGWQLRWTVMDGTGNKLHFDDNVIEKVISGNYRLTLSDYPKLMEKLEEQTIYLVTAVVEELYGASTSSFVTGSGSDFAVFVYNSACVPEITAQPEDTYAQNKGAIVTLTASAAGAEKASWICADTEDIQVITSGSAFDNATGTATLTVPVTAEHQYFCRFMSSGGQTDTQTVKVCFTPQFLGESYAVTGITGEDVILRMPCDGDGSGGCAHYTEQKWQVYNTRLKKWLGVGVENEQMAGVMILKNTTSDAAGRYRRTITTEHGGTINSPAITVTMVDSGEVNIDSVSLIGFDDIYQGDKQPTAADISADDARVEVTDVQWIGMGNGVVGSQGSVAVTLKTKTGYRFYNNGDDLKVTFSDQRNWYGYKILSDPAREITVYKDFPPYNAVPILTDSVKVTQKNFTLTQGETADIQLEYEIVCPNRHAEKHTISRIYLMSEDALPAGLSMDESGHITGTVEETDFYHSGVVWFDTTNGNSWGAPLMFRIEPEAPEAPELHVHEYGQWTPNDADTHIRTCDGCDASAEGHQVTQVHRWSEYEVITRATANN
ncbi:MAG: hypothetical protein IJ072_01760, partial [Oscillospiraceae bacterium]|nr:hypothetical protein [Oscillospiraceae bacterium]